MDRRKRLCIRPARVFGTRGDDFTTHSDSQSAEFSSNIGISALPEEMLLHIFVFLSHGDKLSCRRVSRYWANLLSTATGLTKAATFRVSKASMQVLKASKADWMAYKIEDVNVLTQHERFFRSKLPTITSLQIASCPVVILPKILCHLENLKSLNVYVSNEEIVLSSAFREHHAQTTNRLQSLELLVDTFTMFAKVWPMFGRIKNLLRISVIQHGVGPDDGTMPKSVCEGLIDGLCNSISASRQTLKHLELQFSPDDLTIQTFSSFVERIRNLDLQLTTFGIEPSIGEKFPFSTAFVLELKNFLNSQKMLTKVILPDLERDQFNSHLQDSLIHSLPTTLRELEVPESYCFHETDILEKFCLQRLITFADVWPVLLTNRSVCNLRSLTAGVSADFFSNGIKKLLNLSELHLYNPGNPDLFSDIALQAIIQNLPNLTQLTFQGNANITDYGVTGIKPEYCKLLETRRVPVNFIIPYASFTGLPICALKKLARLEIATSIDISDIGIRYGFAFQQLRELTLEVNGKSGPYGRPRVTNGGLEMIGQLNPSLEAIRFKSSNKKSPTILASHNLISRLKRIQRVSITLGNLPSFGK